MSQPDGPLKARPKSPSPGRLAGQLTVRGILIGCVGCVIITAASVYTALKMGALPWPIVFAAIISLVFLKSLERGKNKAARQTGETLLNEVNVTHTIMSAGAMVAGGLAFTIPGIWMLSHADQVTWWQMLLVALAGVTLGMVCCVLMRRHFMEKSHLEYPIGQAAAQTILAGNAGGQAGSKLFGAMGLAGLYTFLRDWLGVIPPMLFGNLSIPGVAFGIYNSPMLLAVGFLVGTMAVLVWFAGALLGNFGIIVGGTGLGFWDTAGGQAICASLGMGTMMGSGFGVIGKIVIPWLKRGACKNIAHGSEVSGSKVHPDEASKSESSSKLNRSLSAKLGSNGHAILWSLRSTAAVTTLIMAAVALLLCFALDLGPLPSLVVVALAWVTCAMSSQSVGQTGIDPMEIFGLIVLLLVAAFANTTLVQLFFIASIISVSCGLAGDVMNDFKAGQIIGTSPQAQWIGQAIGGVLGALVAVTVMVVLLQAYGAEAFGPQGSFVSAQASVVATMISGIPAPEFFAGGLLVGLILTLLGAPAMMLGLGIYLPFYLSFSAFLGAMLKAVYNVFNRLRQTRRAPQEAKAKQEAAEQTGLIVASGLLGGESVVGVLVALASVVASLIT